MCEPVSVSALALSAVSSGLSMVQQSVNARAQTQYQERVHQMNVEVANESARASYIALGQRALQEREAVAQSLFEVSQRAEAARSTAAVAAGESGTRGASVDALLQEFRVNEVRHQEVLRRNLQFTEAQLDLESRAVQSGHQAQILSTLPQPVPRPNFAAGLLRLGTDAVGQYLQLTERAPGEFLGRSFR